MCLTNTLHRRNCIPELEVYQQSLVNRDILSLYRNDVLSLIKTNNITKEKTAKHLCLVTLISVLLESSECIFRSFEWFEQYRFSRWSGSCSRLPDMFYGVEDLDFAIKNTYKAAICRYVPF